MVLAHASAVSRHAAIFSLLLAVAIEQATFCHQDGVTVGVPKTAD